MKLDLADRKILASLIENSRLPVSAISKNTHLSREIINYRMSKLEQEEIITGYVLRINQSLFCSGIALMTCKLTRSNNERFNEIMSFIKNHHSINWCMETCGTYDLALTILFNNPKDLAKTTTAILNYAGQNLKEHDLSIYIEEFKFDRLGLITEKEIIHKVKRAVSKGDSINSVNLDSTDIHLIRLLSNSCRMKNIELSQKLNIGEDSVRLRIKSLEKRGIIQGYTISIDADKLGFDAYQISAKIENMTDKVINKVKYYAQTNPYIVFCVQTSGKFNLIFNIHTRDRQHLSKLLLDIRNNIPEIIDYELQLNMKTHKEVFVPFEQIKNAEE